MPDADFGIPNKVDYRFEIAYFLKSRDPNRTLCTGALTRAPLITSLTAFKSGQNGTDNTTWLLGFLTPKSDNFIFQNNETSIEESEKKCPLKPTQK